MIGMLIGLMPLFVLMLIITNAMRSEALDQKLSDLKLQSNTISTNLSVIGYFSHGDDDHYIESSQSLMDYRLLLLNNYGEVVYDANGSEESRVYSSKEVIGILSGTSRQNSRMTNDYMTIYTAVLNRDSNEVEGIVIIVDDFGEIYQMIGTVRNVGYLVILALAILMLFLNYYATDRMTKPFRDFLGHLKRVSEGHIDETLDVKGNVEVEEMSRVFNEMLTKIEEIDASRQQFVANVSHELKTPLSSMKVLADSLLAGNEVPAEIYKDFMEDISREVNRETQIINDLLTLVTLDKKDNQLNLEPTSINQLIEQVMRMLKPLAETQQVVLEIKSYRDVIALVDETKLYLVFMNLIENGIKYNRPNGKVSVSINSDHRDMVIKVEDTGIGIPDESVNKVFDRFYRVDKTRSRDTGGTGLGLNIVHKTVLMHGGNVRCNSVLETGTTFTVRIPLKPPNKG